MKAVRYFLGTDEAGYGPNLGPLVVSLSVWRFTFDEKSQNISPPSNPPSLFDALPPESDADPLDDGAIQRFNAALTDHCGRKSRFPIIDSKKLYVSGRLAPLERSLLTAARILFGEKEPFTFRSILKQLKSDRPDFLPPWENEVDFTLPFAEENKDGGSFIETNDLVERIRNSGVELIGLASRRVQPEEFNRRLGFQANKSDLLADVTLTLAAEGVRRVIKNLSPDERSESPQIILLCDKLGGRNDYSSPLGAYFPEYAVQTVCQSRALSGYRLDRLNRPSERLTVRFQAKGESNIPTALASIASKYLRELSMIPFNRFWRRALPELRPTAGYPEDAKRFLSEIKEVQARLGIEDRVLWREK